MEVHHHPHLPHVKKKWKEYLAEFFMLFLAVTLGFFAESLRERMSDNEKEKQYIESLLTNLREDTAAISNAIAENKGKAERLEALMQLSLKNFTDTAIRTQLYRHAANSIGYYAQFKANDATMEQLKSAGSLRYIRKGHVADSIAVYDNQVKVIYAAETLYNTASQTAILAAEDVFDYTVYYDSNYYYNGHFTGRPLPLLTTDNNKIKAMMNRVDFEISATQNYINNLQLRLPVAVRLIEYLKTTYGIE